MKNKIELMAPAGSYESLQAAINSGADSIYFGVAQLNMRARSANNFDLDDLYEIAAICHAAGVKAYLTLNTILYNHDQKLMHTIIDAVKKSEVDSIIVADIAAIQYARKVGVNVHISTQLSISNIETVRFWARYADVVVLARELDMTMITEICQAIRQEKIIGPSGNLLKVEVFAHGALCIAISGRCGMSLASTNSSANRGACKQNCRHSYRVIDKESGNELDLENEFIMSPKDICTIDFLDRFIATGIKVLKIEGRGRSPDYVAVVIRVYREALDAIAAGYYTPIKVKEWQMALKTVFNRGFSDGYYLGKKLGAWSASAGSQATEEKVFVGIVTKYYPKIGVVEVKVQASKIALNDKIIFTGLKIGVVVAKVGEMRNEVGDNIKIGELKTVISIPIKEKLFKGDKLYLLKPTEYAQKS